MRFVEGDTFQYGDYPNALHLHVVICGATAVAQTVVVVSFNTARDHTDNTLILHPGEHSFVTRETAVSYNQARMLLISSLNSIATANQGLHPNLCTFLPEPPVSPELLKRLVDGALFSPLTPKGVKREIRIRLGMPSP